MEFVQLEEEELVEVRLVDKDEKTEYILKISPADVIKAQKDKKFLAVLQNYARAIQNGVETNIDEVSSAPSVATNATTNLPSKTGTFSTQSNLVQASGQHTNQTFTMKWKQPTSNQKNQLAEHLKISKLSAQTNISAENGPIGPIRLAPKTSNTSKTTTVKPKLILNVLLQNVPKMKTIMSTNKSYSNVMSNNYRQVNVADKSGNKKLVHIHTHTHTHPYTYTPIQTHTYTHTHNEANLRRRIRSLRANSHLGRKAENRSQSELALEVSLLIIMDSLFGAKPYMAPISTMSSTGTESSNVCSNNSNSSSNSSTSCTMDVDNNNISHKRKKKSDIGSVIMEIRTISEEGKKRRHEEKMDFKLKLWRSWIKY